MFCVLFVDSSGIGSLCWCGINEVRSSSPSRTLQLNRTVEICLAKQTKAFNAQGAEEADPDCCFSILVDVVSEREVTVNRHEH